MSREESLSRREFLKVSAAGVTALSLGELLLSPSPALGYVNKDPINPAIDNTRVVYVQDDALTVGTGPLATWAEQNAATNDANVAAAIDQMARALAEEPSIPAAWQKIFLKPAAKNWSDVVVAIKTNNIGVQHTRNAVMKKFCFVLVDHLGVTGSNIHIYDGCHGYNMSSTTPFYGLPSGVRQEGTWGGSNTTLPVPAPGGGTARCVQSIANGTVDILINIALCKGHDSVFGRCTGSMKNHYGTWEPRDHSTVNYVIGINKSEAILGAMDPGTGRILFPRQQVCFVDALWASDDGPTTVPSCRPNRLMMGTFAPVLDYLVAKRFRNQTMGWTINTTVVNRFLSDFGYADADLVNGGQMIDATLYNAVPDWIQFR